jgi:outer membrane receptor protein involved in Fe transport
LEVPGYGLLNAHASYKFSGTLEGLEAAVDGFNLSNNKHFEILEARGTIDLGQSGEQIRRRVVATLSYRF